MSATVERVTVVSATVVRTAMERTAMGSEWLKVMLDEVARKKDEAELDRLETQRRLETQPRPDNGSAASVTNEPPAVARHESTGETPAGSAQP